MSEANLLDVRSTRPVAWRTLSCSVVNVVDIELVLLVLGTGFARSLAHINGLVAKGCKIERKLYAFFEEKGASFDRAGSRFNMYDVGRKDLRLWLGSLRLDLCCCVLL